ncbi:MAG: radical SAM protein [Candidatus Thermoplasmatota archaeon]|nr:radical SAM protein [Candidatus Thermoplasmatota archaeon]
MRQKRWTPYAALYELTLRCNMRCIHCGSTAGRPREKELNTEDWNTITEQLADLRCKEITLLGGEPFLQPDWYSIASTITTYGINVTIISNASCITSDIILKLRTLEPYAIGISIDGGTPLTHDSLRQHPGSFDTCIQTLEKLTNANLPTTVITTLNKNNIQELPLLRNILVKKGVAWQLQIAAPIGRFPRELALSKEEFYAAALFIATTRKTYSMKELPILGAHCFGYHSQTLPNINLLPIWRGCQAGISLLGIQSDGAVKGCLSLPEEYIEGNIKNTSLEDLWSNPTTFSYNRRFSTDDLINTCQGCSFGKTCKGGCLALSTATTGKPHGDPYCLKEIEKKFR